MDVRSHEYVTFIGLAVNTGLALIDTGAQTAVVGRNTFSQMKDEMEKFGVKPLRMDVTPTMARGVGGAATPIGVWSLPIGVA
eukprot:3579716-Amphidinium_carterae.1